MKRKLTLVGTAVCLLALAAVMEPGQEVMASEGKTAAEQLLARGDELFLGRKFDQALEAYMRTVKAAEGEKQEDILAEALAQVARCHLKQDQKEEGRPWLERAEAVASPDTPLGWSRYLGVRGRYEWKDGRLETATATFKEMYDYCLGHELHERAVDAAHMVAITAPHQEQVLWAQRGISAAEEGNLEGWLGPLWNNLGWTYEEMGRHQEALKALIKAREYHWKLGSEHNKLVADWSVGHAHRLLGRLAEAEQWLRPVLAWAERHYAADPNPDAAEWVGHSCRELGELAIARGLLEAGLNYLRRAKEKLAEAQMPEWDPDGYGELGARIDEIAGQVPSEKVWHTVVHFEIPFDVAPRAVSFYGDLFGWEIVKVPEMDYWIVNTVPTDEQGQPLEPGINGGMMKREVPQQSPVNYVSVESVDDYLRKAKALGGQVIVPKTAVPQMGWFAHLADTEGNMFGIFEDDPGAE